MIRTLYEKRGRRYVPVSHYDPAAIEGMPPGAHLVVVSDGGRFTRYRIDADHARVLAALHSNRDVLLQAMRNASRVRVSTEPLTPRERKAVASYYEIMGPDALLRLTVPGAHEILDALEKAICEG